MAFHLSLELYTFQTCCLVNIHTFKCSNFLYICQINKHTKLQLFARFQRTYTLKIKHRPNCTVNVYLEIVLSHEHVCLYYYCNSNSKVDKQEIYRRCTLENKPFPTYLNHSCRTILYLNIVLNKCQMNKYILCTLSMSQT